MKGKIAAGLTGVLATTSFAAVSFLGAPAALASGAKQVTTDAQGVAAAAAPQASLNCKTSVGNTGGWVECRGKGTWRVKSICNNEGDKYTTWHSQRGGKQRVYAVQCTWDIEDVTYEVK